MTEYPQDGRKGMSELKNGYKWLRDLPQSLLTATARVRGKLFFVGELLQCQPGGFFIPDRFFTREEVPDQASSPIDILFALGNTVTKTPVSDHICWIKYPTMADWYDRMASRSTSQKFSSEQLNSGTLSRIYNEQGILPVVLQVWYLYCHSYMLISIE